MMIIHKQDASQAAGKALRPRFAAIEHRKKHRAAMNMDEVTAIAASGLVSAATLSALVKALEAKGLITPQEVHEIYEDALLMIEGSQGAVPESQEVFKLARELIEQHLRPPKPHDK